MLRKAIFRLLRAGRAFVDGAFEDCLDDPARCDKGGRKVPDGIGNDGHRSNVSAYLHHAHRVNRVANTPYPGKQPGAASGVKSVPAGLCNPLSYGRLSIAYRLIFFIFFPSTIDVSIWRSEIAQYFRSKSSLLSINV